MSGYIANPLAAGVITQTDMLADLAVLCSGRHPGRKDTTGLTLFKSAGLAIEDLAAANLIVSENPISKEFL